MLSVPSMSLPLHCKGARLCTMLHAHGWQTLGACSAALMRSLHFFSRQHPACMGRTPLQAGRHTISLVKCQPMLQRLCLTGADRAPQTLRGLGMLRRLEIVLLHSQTQQTQKGWVGIKVLASWICHLPCLRPGRPRCSCAFDVHSAILNCAQTCTYASLQRRSEDRAYDLKFQRACMLCVERQCGAPQAADAPTCRCT